ncbi:hypothetical protein FFI16_021120 [Pseudomonas sp. KBS0710]|nr:hypothetical protein FFI16_021120 [Pseudomonas sp. KBS0710]
MLGGTGASGQQGKAQGEKQAGSGHGGSVHSRRRASITEDETRCDKAEFCVDRAGPFASKPAPTFERIPRNVLGKMWERACSRRGH